MDGRPQKSFRFYEDRLNSMFELTKRFPVNEQQLLLLSCTFVRRTSMDMSVSQNNKNGPAKGIYGVTLRSSQPHYEKHGQASRTFFLFARLIVHLRLRVPRAV